jgi:hypothetical protein
MPIDLRKWWIVDREIQRSYEADNSVKFMNYTKTRDMGYLCYNKCGNLKLH